MSKHHIRLLSALTLALVASTPGIAQQPLTPSPQLYASKPIMVSPLSGDEKKEVVLLSVTIQPSGAVPMHSHPGDCVGSVVEGTVELLMEGQPPKRISAGEGYSNLRGTVHGFRNVAETQAKLLNNLVIDKGAPRIQPATQGPMQ